MRILHLIDPGSPGGGGPTLQLLAQTTQRMHSLDHDVLIIGNSRQVEVARRCGVEPIGHISPPGSKTTLALRGLDRFLASRAKTNARYDIIHTWTADTALLATLAAADHRRVATLAIGPVSGLTMQTLATALHRCPMPLLATSAGVRAEYLSMGIDPTLISMLAPGINPNLVSEHQNTREMLRRRWNVGKREFVVGLLSEPLRWADVRRAVHIGAVVNKTGRSLRLICHPRSMRFDDARDWLSRFDLDEILLEDDDLAEPWKVTPALDATLLLGGASNTSDLRAAGSPLATLIGGGRGVRPMPGVMPLLWSFAAGVAVIAETSPAGCGMIDEGRTGLLVPQGDLNAVAERLLRLIDDRTIGNRLGAAGREVINERYHISRYCVRLRDIYDRLVEDRPVRVVAEGNPPLVERYEQSTASWVQT